VTDALSATTIAQPFVAAVTETFGSLLGLEAIGTPVDDALEDDSASREGISALIEFSGPRFGVVLVTFAPDTARAVVERMLAGAHAAIEDGDITDGIGELVNIVSGRAKAVLSAIGFGRLEMSVPTVLTGFSLVDLGLQDADWSRIDFATEIGSFTLRVAFARGGASSPVRILLADDSRVMRKIEKAALETLGAVEFLEASDGTSAIDIAEKRDYDLDLLVLDLKMPEKDGYAVLEHIRKSPKGLTIPVIVVSSIAPSEASPRLSAVSPEGSAPLVFVGKPFDPKELLDAASRLALWRAGDAEAEAPPEGESSPTEAAS
jgi:CheY-like chemotaxis protein/CheY-specific phosphatase CheX